jgi:hypothetical protein
MSAGSALAEHEAGRHEAGPGIESCVIAAKHHPAADVGNATAVRAEEPRTGRARKVALLLNLGSGRR